MGATTTERNAWRAAGSEALAGIDRALAEKPHADGHVLSEIIRALCRMRDVLTDRRRADPALARATEPRLMQINTLLSIVLATQFPLGAIQWDALEAARGVLAELLTAV